MDRYVVTRDNQGLYEVNWVICGHQGHVIFFLSAHFLDP